MRKTRTQIKQEVENKMIELHNRTYKYRIFDAHRGQITIEYRKGTIVVDEYFTIEEARDIKLQSIGI
jgi:hypothetical protein